MVVKAASVGIGIRSVLMDLGVNKGRIIFKTDASAALGVDQRLGIGKNRHIEVNQLWLRETVGKKEVLILKLGTKENLADALTKAVDARIIEKHSRSRSTSANRQT